MAFVNQFDLALECKATQGKLPWIKDKGITQRQCLCRCSLCLFLNQG